MKEFHRAVFVCCFPDINECIAFSHDCDISVSNCVNDVPGFHCECHERYVMIERVCQGRYLLDLNKIHCLYFIVRF